MCSAHICLEDRKTPAEAVTAGVFSIGVFRTIEFLYRNAEDAAGEQTQEKEKIR